MQPDTKNQTTPPTPAGTEGAPAPAATQPQGERAATDNGDTVTLSNRDYKNLIADRDRNNQKAKEADEAAAQAAAASEESEAFLEEIARERAITKFLKDNQEKFPDVTMDDLAHATPATLESEAARIQRRLEDHTQSKLLDIENPTAPRLSPEDRAAREKQLAESPQAGGLAEVIGMRLQS